MVSLLLGGCSPTEEAPKTSLTLNLQEGDPPSLNPYVGVDLRSRCLYLALYEPLMRKDAKGNLQPAAAERVEVDSTQTVYTFHIRPHVWSNGEPVTSHHFEKAWKFALDPATPCVRSDLFYPIKNAERAKSGQISCDAVCISCPDKKTLVVELEQPTPYFLDLTATSFFLPLYTPSIEEPIHYNGPYTLAQHTPDECLVFDKNLSYWDAPSVQVDRVNFLMIRDPMTALGLFEKGDLDVVGDPFSTLPFDVIPTLVEGKQLKSTVVSRIFYLLINTTHSPLNNKFLRQALSASIDRELFTKHLFFGQHGALSLLPEPLSLILPAELEKEKKDCLLLFDQALKELGLTRATFPTLTLSYAELSGQKKMAEFVQQSWKENLGIEVHLKCSEWNVHSADLKSKNYEIGALHLTTLYQDPMFYFDLFRDKESLSNYCGWESPLFQEYLQQSDFATNPICRNALLKAAEWCLIDEMPAIPLFTHNFQYLQKKDVNIALTELGIYDLKHAQKRYNAL